MSSRLKIFFASLMSLALAFGYLTTSRIRPTVLRGCISSCSTCAAAEPSSCSLRRGEAAYAQERGLFGDRRHLRRPGFLEMYIPAMAASVILALIVESIRMKKFSVFPWGFVRKNEPVSAKFHQASLLCLSLGLLISTAVILNNQYMHWIYLPKLTLNVFFLGFSFPPPSLPCRSFSPLWKKATKACSAL